MFPTDQVLVLLHFLKISFIKGASESDGSGVLVTPFKADLGPLQAKVQVNAILLVTEVLAGDGNGPDGIEDGIGSDGLDGWGFTLPGSVGNGSSAELGIRLATDCEVGRLSGRWEGLVGKLQHVLHVKLDLGPVAPKTGDRHDRLGGGGLLLETLGGDESCLDTDIGRT